MNKEEHIAKNIFFPRTFFFKFTFTKLDICFWPFLDIFPILSNAHDKLLEAENKSEHTPMLAETGPLFSFHV